MPVASLGVPGRRIRVEVGVLRGGLVKKSPRQKRPATKTARRRNTKGARPGPARRRARRRPRRAARRKDRALLLKLAASLFLLVAVTFSAAAVYYYGKFTRLIDAHLAEQPQPTAAVYARPFVVRSGQTQSPNTLAEKLQSLGYKADTGAENWYQASGAKLLFGHRLGERRHRYEITFSGSRIVSTHRDGEHVAEAETLPRFLSSLFGSARVKRKRVRYDELPATLRQAVLASEDEHFFSHPGIDLTGLLRAVLVDLVSWERRQGGSTITQQFIKNYFLTSDKEWGRKFQEVYFALLLERRLGKEEILQLYCNEVYLGQLGSFAIHGFGQAATSFFGKNVGELTLEESALLAGMIQSPNRYSPHRHPDAARARRNYVLHLMESKGMISRLEKAQAEDAPLSVRPVSAQDYSEAPHFIDYVAELVREDYGLSGSVRGNLRVESTLDRDLQRAAFEAVAQGLQRVDRLVSKRRKPPAAQVALLAVHPRNGEILAMIGGREYASAQYNRATRAFRQPGSTFKPFVYASALQKGHPQHAAGYTLSTRIMDEPYTFSFDNQKYSPRNHGNQYRGLVTLREALAFSLNVPTVKLAEQIGFDEVRQTSRRLGFGEKLKAYPSIALGAFEVSLLQLAQAYQVLAGGGRLVPLSAIRRVKLEDQLVSFAGNRSTYRVFEPETAFLVTSALQSVLGEGTAGSARRGGFTLPAAGKTGTTSDSWFVGYTPELLCAVWVGTDEPPPLNLAGAQAALPIWTNFMLKAQQLGYLSGDPFPVPPKITAVEIDPRSGLRASRNCEQVRTEFFLTGTEPGQYCSRHQYQLAREQDKTQKKGRLWRWLGKIF